MSTNIDTVSKDDIRKVYFKTVSKNKVVAFLSTNNLSTFRKSNEFRNKNEKEMSIKYAKALGLDSWVEVQMHAPIVNDFFVIEFDTEEKGLNFIENLDTEYPDYCCLYIDGKFRYENT